MIHGLLLMDSGLLSMDSGLRSMDCEILSIGYCTAYFRWIMGYFGV